MIFPFWGDLNQIPSGYAYCDGANGTPDLRGAFISSTGNGIGLGAKSGSNTLRLVKENLPGNALVSLKGYFATGGIERGIHSGGENSNDETYVKQSWGTSYGAEIVHGMGSTNADMAPGAIYFRSFNAAISSIGWNGQPFENRPLNVALHYIMKI